MPRELVCQTADLYVAVNDCGRGVYARRPFATGEVVEICPILCVFPIPPVRNAVSDYEFWFDDGRHCVPAGFGSLYNHSETPNLDFDVDTVRKTLTFEAIRPIETDEELVFRYGCDLWFKTLPTEHRAEGERGA